MTKKKSPKEKTIVDDVLAIFDSYLDTTGAIIADYVPDSGMLLELAEADKQFKEDIKELDITELMQFDDLFGRLKEIEEVDSNKLLSLCDKDAVWNWAASKGYAIIKIENLQDQTKLEEFVTTELYPNYNDKSNYNF